MLTEQNYYENHNYMSASLFKDFLKCPACAMAKLNGEWKPEKSDALLLGSYVDESLTGTPESQAIKALLKLRWGTKIISTPAFLMA